MSCTATTEQLEKVKMELDNKTFLTYTLDQILDKQVDKLVAITNRYGNEKKYWAATINNLEHKIKVLHACYTKVSTSVEVENPQLVACSDSVVELLDLNPKEMP